LLEKLHSTELKLRYGYAITALCDLVAKAAHVYQLSQRLTSLLEEHFTCSYATTSLATTLPLHFFSKKNPWGVQL